jgi:hypothetical protein
MAKKGKAWVKVQRTKGSEGKRGSHRFNRENYVYADVWGLFWGTSKRYKVSEQIRSLICPFFWLGPLTSNALTIGKPRDKTLRMNFCRKKSLKINSPEKKTSNHQSSYI